MKWQFFLGHSDAWDELAAIDGVMLGDNCGDKFRENCWLQKPQEYVNQEESHFSWCWSQSGTYVIFAYFTTFDPFKLN